MMTHNFKNIFLHVYTFCSVIVILALVEPALVQAQSYDAPSAAAAEIRFQQLEKEIRRLTGMVEEQNYEIRRLREELLKSTSDLSVRVNDLEQGGGSSSVASSSDASSNSSAVANSMDKPKWRHEISESVMSDNKPEVPPTALNESLNGNVKTLGTLKQKPDSDFVFSSDAAPREYERAYSFIKKRDFESAEKAFATFIKNFPKHSLVSNAKYWYGETFYVRGGYDKAARIFAEGYQQFPRGPKAASNLLKLGMSLTGMGKTDDACIAYKQLKKDYAKSSVPVLNRAKTEMKRIKCK